MLNVTAGIRAGLFAASMALFAGAADAQTYPNGQVRLIVPTPAGGVTDTMARIVAQRLGETLNQTVIVDNRPGGNGGVGSQAVERSPADGLTLLVTSDATITANPYLSSKLSYDAKAFTPIIVLCRGTPVLVVNASVPAKSTQELIALAKSKPGTLNYGSYGIGTYAHLSMEDFKQRTGTDIVHIPFRGAAPAANALLGGDVNMLLLNLSSIADHEKTGKVRILAAAGAKRDRRAARPADHGGGRRAGLPDLGVVRDVRAAEHAAGAGAEDSRRRQQGAGPAAVEGVLREEQLRAGDPVAARIRQAGRRRTRSTGKRSSSRSARRSIERKLPCHSVPGTAQHVAKRSGALQARDTRPPGRTKHGRRTPLQSDLDRGARAPLEGRARGDAAAARRADHPGRQQSRAAPAAISAGSPACRWARRIRRR